MKLKNNQRWRAKGKKAIWTIWNIDNKKDIIALTREDILNSGMGGKRYEKFISKEDLLRRYEQIRS